MSQTDYLTAMGISTWVLNDADDAVDHSPSEVPQPLKASQAPQEASATQTPKVSATPVKSPQTAPVQPLAMDPAYAQAWTFVVDQLNGDASLLFDKILASLMLSRKEVQILTSTDVLGGQATGQVIVAMGSDMGKKILQMSEPFEELRGAVHSLEAADMEWPIVLTYHPEHLLKRALDKSKTWQDLILARSLI
jgi:hypothetical protein